MRRFQFRLERFLDLRRWKEREWEIRLAQATGKVVLLKNRIEEIGAEIGVSYDRTFTRGAAIDVLQSISRLALQVTGPRTREAAGIIRRHLATYAGAEDLISVGAYAKGSNAEIDAAIERRGDIEGFLIQAIGERAPMADTLRRAGSIAGVEIPEEELAEPPVAAPSARGSVRGAEPADAAPSARGSARGADATVPVQA